MNARTGCSVLFAVFCGAGLAAQVAPGEALPRSYAYREAGGRPLRLHVFAPGERRALPARTHAILLFHGGGWASGAADWTFATARRFADEGLVAISVEYRLSQGSITPVDALHDACAAFEWVRTNAMEVGFNGRMAGYGVSAGGHLVAATVTIGCPATARSTSALPEALVLWSPALDVSRDGWFVKLLQGRGTAEALSPALHVGSLTPPTSIVQGDKDTLTPLAGARRYCDALSARGRPCELHVYPGVGHLLTRNLANQESNFDPDPAARADGVERQLAFLRRVGLLPARRQGR
jgi:acetyl esterase/lipase